ncbi:MAG: SDR family oxidoreductase [candidate division Zixibacteria bacterium]|nr:SDR family oxidoreductase [candidate division Zixibacteria bacterium]
MSKVCIIGATSAIAQETAKLYAGRKDSLFIVGRDDARLTAIAEDLKIRGAASVNQYALDLTDISRHEDMIDTAWSTLSGIDIVLIAHGVLGQQDVCEKDYSEAARVFDANFASAASLLTILANRFEVQKSGTIAVISSVAGDRGRKSNYIYGASKAAKSTFLDGLRGRLQKSGVQVLTIKPGFVDTPMTKEFKKGLLWAKPEGIAGGIVKAIDKKKDIAYLPFFWYWIMFIIRHIPEKIFKKLSI